MTVTKIDVLKYSFGSLCGDYEGVCHRKTLPVLSVVQPTRGSYDISLGGGKTCRAAERSAFAAPSGVMQSITHHNGEGGRIMESRWLFLDVSVNGIFKLDSLYSFPTVLPEKYNPDISEVMETVAAGRGICSDLSAIYRLIGILLEEGTRRELNPQKELVMRYVSDRYGEKITAAQLADLLHISASGVYRFFRSGFGMPPSGYVNEVRLEHASLLLSQGGRAVGEVAAAVGIDDVFYFSKLFRRRYGISPSAFRASNSYRG